MFKKFLKVGCLGFIGLVVISLVIGLALNGKQSTTVNQQKEETLDKVALAAELTQILNDVPQIQDEVEHQVEYKTFGDSYNPEKALHYSLVIKDKEISDVYIHIVHFTSDINWVFWNKLIFANGDKKWEKNINAITGQMGDGKNTEVVMGGKYETWKGKLSEVKEGLTIITNGDKPILRLSGRYQDDVYLTTADVQRMKQALRLQEIIDTLGHTLPQ